MTTGAGMQCPRCRAGLDDAFGNGGQMTPCPICGNGLEIHTFPALYRPLPRGMEGQPLMVEGEAGCFYHPQKKATVHCQGCGRFLCALCDCELNGQHFCPACLETGKKKGKIQNLENQRTLYGNIALALAIYPVLLVFGIYFTIITAPIAIFLALWHWNGARSIVSASRVRHILAIVLGFLELGGWAAAIYFIVVQGGRHG